MLARLRAGSVEHYLRCKSRALALLFVCENASVYMPLANLRILRIQARADASSAAATRAPRGLDACFTGC